MGIEHRGGARAGAGRKPNTGKFGEPTRQMRVPESKVPAVASFLTAAAVGKRQAAADARIANIRSLAQEVPPVALRFSDSGIPCGFPSPALDYAEEEIDLNTHLIRAGHTASTYIVRAEGWSMVGAGIHDGDEIVVDRAIEPRDGHVVVAAVNGELVVKTLHFRAGVAVLVSANPHYPERVIAQGEELEIWGVCTRVLHALL